jgi:hypothetical protein
VQDVVLGVGAHPGSFTVSVEVQGEEGANRGEWRWVPDIVEHAGHHPLLGLPHSFIQRFGFAFALYDRGMRTDRAVGVHVLARWGEV